MEDSRTGGRPSRDVSSFVGGRPLTGGLLCVGLLDCRGLGALPVVTTSPGEYDEAELGVGTWLNGESVYRVEGVADGA